MVNMIFPIISPFIHGIGIWMEWNMMMRVSRSWIIHMECLPGMFFLMSRWGSIWINWINFCSEYISFFDFFYPNIPGKLKYMRKFGKSASKLMFQFRHKFLIATAILVLFLICLLYKLILRNEEIDSRYLINTAELKRATESVPLEKGQKIPKIIKISKI